MDKLKQNIKATHAQLDADLEAGDPKAKAFAGMRGERNAARRSLGVGPLPQEHVAPESPTEIPTEPNLPLTQAEHDRLEKMSMLGRDVWFKNKGVAGKWLVGRVEDEVYVMVGDYKHLIQKIRFADGRSWDGSTFAYRTGYYTYQHGRKAIKWGQYTQFLTEKEYSTLLQRRREAKGGRYSEKAEAIALANR